ncbi:hypothetical protein L7F22_030158 [Adiantum nelumboides]|nr:hypothetical protein [Adiantum nelumboides]
MRRRSSSKGVYPVHDSGAPVYLPVSQERRWLPLLICFIVVVNIAMFIITMYVNNCPANTANDQCVAKFLGRFSFQPFSENPLLGPSTRALRKVGALDTNKGQSRLASCLMHVAPRWSHSSCSQYAKSAGYWNKVRARVWIFEDRIDLSFVRSWRQSTFVALSSE